MLFRVVPTYYYQFLWDIHQPPPTIFRRHQLHSTGIFPQESEYSMPLAQSFQRCRLGVSLLEGWKMGRDIWLMRWLLGYVIRKCDINGIHMGYKWDITWIFMGKLQRPHVATSLEWLLVIIAQIAELCRSVNYYLPRHMIDGQLISPYFSIFDGYPLVN